MTKATISIDVDNYKFVSVTNRKKKQFYGLFILDIDDRIPNPCQNNRTLKVLMNEFECQSFYSGI